MTHGDERFNLQRLSFSFMIFRELRIMEKLLSNDIAMTFEVHFRLA